MGNRLIETEGAHDAKRPTPPSQPDHEAVAHKVGSDVTSAHASHNAAMRQKGAAHMSQVQMPNEIEDSKADKRADLMNDDDNYPR